MGFAEAPEAEAGASLLDPAAAYPLLDRLRSALVNTSGAQRRAG
jgi:hypothetical protein